MSKKVRTIPLHSQILIGIFAGILCGTSVIFIQGGHTFIQFYVAPFGNIFLKLLQLIAIPVILTSLITGLAKIKDVKKIGSMGLKTVIFFICTTLIATTIGVIIADIIRPGKSIDENIKKEMIASMGVTSDDISDQLNTGGSPLTFIENMVPSNFFQSISSNQNMIQVVLFAILFGVALSRIGEEKAKPVLLFLEGTNEALTLMINLIMKIAPLGVFALVASVLAKVSAGDLQKSIHLLSGLAWYSLSVLTGLCIMICLVYPVLFYTFSGTSYSMFFKSMRSAFLLAFTSSSSSATLPLTMQCVEKNLKVDKEIAGFVLPFGTTINMDGTALYQCVAAIFIAQFFNLELSWTQQIVIILTATTAAAGAAGIPGAGMVTLIMILQNAGLPTAGINLILIPDRILDMCRTVINVAGDVTACLVVKGRSKA
ncbi:MAG: dicarboxylate/amino acid:cation symporter [Cytophagaceae bacterium]|nr:dicarboxylate/amino acid:cation symporter [Cytophagaceae bacterium]MDW8455595.1 dicarboxylate/amino acid:cation symporter [Cytophagaceae bacterium]